MLPEWTLLTTLPCVLRARLAQAHRHEEGVSEIVAILLAVSAVIIIAGAVFVILANKARQSANSKNF